MIEKIKKTRTGFAITIITGVVIILEIHLQPMITEFLENLKLSKLSPLAIYFIALLISIGIVPLSFKFFDNYLWKKIFPKYNFNGNWRYENKYKGEKGRKNSTGKVKIVQTPTEIKFIKGESDDDNEYDSEWYSILGNLKKNGNDFLEIDFAYRVLRKDDVEFNFTKESIAKLKINKNSYRKNPEYMEGHFWNALRDKNPKFKKGGEKDNWLPAHGEFTYTKLN